MAAMVKLSYKEQVQRMREDAIVEAVNRLLAAKGYDAMTVDEVAAEAGIAKASVYKHFASKEDLAAAAMVRALDRAMAFVDGLRENPKAQPFEQLKAVAGWAISSQLANEMPLLPSQNSSLTNSLQAHEAYMDRLISLSNKLSIWITEAQTSGQHSPQVQAAQTWQRLHSELQMLLYTHPFNDARSAQGLLPVNAFWVHGAGPLHATAPSGVPVQVEDALRAPALRQDWAAWASAWAALDAGPLARLHAQMARGTPVQLTLCGQRSAITWHSGGRSLRHKISSIFRPQRFADVREQL